MMPSHTAMQELKPDALDVTVAIHDRRWHEALPNVAVFCDRVIRFVLMSQTSRWYRQEWADISLEVACVMTDDQEIMKLNSRFRGQDKPTNVLSFEADPEGPHMDGSPRVLGDIIISLDTLLREAAEQGKTLQDHTAHMLVHGTLHLLGLDHIQNDEAEIMEKIEIEALSALGVANPYRTSFTA